MDKQSQHFESFIRKACNNQKVIPSEKVLRKLKGRLMMSDFLSLNLRKFNIYYSMILVGGAAALLLIDSSEEQLQLQAVKGGMITEHNSHQNTIIPKNGANSDITKTETHDEKSKISTGASVKALFTASVQKGCVPLTIHFINNSSAATLWQWDFGTGDQTTDKNPSYTYSKAGKYSAILSVMNGSGLQDTYRQEIEVLDKPSANFEVDLENSDIGRKILVFKNRSAGGKSFTWDFGDNTTMLSEEPTHTYADFAVYKVRLVAMNSSGCSDTTVIVNKFIEKNYELSFPLNFRPNPVERNSGYYDNAGTEASVFHPRNFGAVNYQLNIFAPNGLKVFSSTSIKQGWNGYIGGRLAPSGNYSWTASGTYPNGKQFDLTGTVKVISQDFE